jgi:Swiss Army Knife RNA repair-like protein
MKVIFLDIDGVLNCDKTPNPRDLPYVVDKKLLTRFRKLLERTGAKVVLTTSWRIDPIGLYAAKYWHVPFMDACPDMPEQPRREEILGWLKRHPKVTRYVVIDDEDDELDELPLFQPSGKTGITAEIVRGVERYLSGKSNETMRRNAIERLVQNVEALFKRDKN